MNELFETVLTLSVFGLGITAVLLALKPITAKKFPARWQYYVWIAVLFSMIIPIYKLIPQQQAQKIQFMTQRRVESPKTDIAAETEIQAVTPQALPVTERELDVTPTVQIKLFDLMSYIWLAGMAVFLVTVMTSYIIYIYRRKAAGVSIEDNSALAEVKKELKIRRKIRVRMSPEIGSPMLVGVFFPVVYMPCKEIPPEMMRMVFLHELTHFKRKDLMVKWFALLVNAIHWFNPFSYLLSANLSEACEVSCDMAVTKNMSDEEQKLYMKTILELVE